MAYFLFTKAISEGKPIRVYNHGDLYRDFTYIDDIVEGIVKITLGQRQSLEPEVGIQKSAEKSFGLEAEGDNRQKAEIIRQQSTNCFIYNIGNSSPVKLLDFIETIENALGKKAIKEFCEMQPGDVYKTYADVSPLERDFGWKPTTAVEKGIKEFVGWYKGFYK
jgi:UDP-glucuronate 4-epimerase